MGVSANLVQAASSGHGWLMAIAPAAGGAADVDAAHAGMRDALDQAWRELLSDDPSRAARLPQRSPPGFSRAASAQLAAGRPVDLVVAVSRTATQAVVRALT